MNKYVSRLKSVSSAMRFARAGNAWKDKALIFLLIGFGTTSFANKRRRAWLKYLINRGAQNDLIEVCFKGRSGDRVFILRADNEADFSVACEFFHGAYLFPDFTPKQIVDGGANIGLFSITAADRFPGAQVDCYEPSRDNIEILRHNLSRNGVAANVRVAALWSSETTVTFLDAQSHTGAVSVHDEVGAGYQTCAVLPTIDDDCWLKLDIEGAEYEVLPALFATGRFPRWISAELHAYHLKGAGLNALLAANGYKLFGFPSDPKVELANVYAVKA